MPEVVPVPLPRVAAAIVGQHHVIGGRRADCPLKTSEVELIVAAAEHIAEGALKLARANAACGQVWRPWPRAALRSKS